MGSGGPCQKGRINSTNRIKEITMKHGFSALALTALLAGPVAAQDSTLSGTVAEVFDRQIVLAAPEGRMLVTLPDDATVPEAGARVNLTGTAEGRSFTASSLSLAPAEAPAPATAPQAQAQAGELPQPLRDLVFQQPVAPRGLDIATQKLHPLDRLFAVAGDADLDDRGHQPLDALADPVVGIVRTAQIGLGDHMGHRLVDGIPSVFQQLVVDPAVRQRQRGDLDKVDQLAGFDEAFGVWPRLDGAIRFACGHVRYLTALTFVGLWA